MAGEPGIKNANSEMSELGVSLRVSFLLITTLIFLLFRDDPGLTTFSLVFVSIILEAFPFMLLGALVSGFVEVFISKDRLASALPKKRVFVTLAAACLGVIFPVCECAIVPVVRRFLRKGVPISAAIAYLLAGPIFNPVVGASTWVAYSSNSGWIPVLVVIIRLLSGFFIAWGIGLLIGRIFPDKSALIDSEKNSHDNKQSCCSHNHPNNHQNDNDKENNALSMRILRAINHGIDDFLDVSQYLIIGAFIAGLLQTIVSRQAFLDIALIPVFAIPVMMILAFVLNLCSEADAFIAASFRNTLPLSAQMAFMVLGPMLDIKLIIMYLSVFKKRTIVVLSLVILVVVLIMMSVLHSVLGDWYSLPAGYTPA